MLQFLSFIIAALHWAFIGAFAFGILSFVLVSRSALFDSRAFQWLVGIATTYVGLYWLVKLGTYSPCYTEMLGEVSNLSGFDFEISETDCWHNPVASIFVSKAGHSTKTRIFQYYRGRGPVPTITLVGKNTVQISLSNLESIHCRTETWGPLKIKYDIGVVDLPSRHVGLPVCR